VINAHLGKCLIVYITDIQVEDGFHDNVLRLTQVHHYGLGLAHSHYNKL